MFLHEIRHKDVFHGPTRQMDPTSGIELCKESLMELHNFDEWKNGDTNCEKYFCEGNSEIINQLKKTNLTRRESIKYHNLHIMAHRHCVQCAQTIHENFQNFTCKFFNRNYCQKKCTSTCIYFKGPELRLCYQNDIEKFYHIEDFTHKYIVPVVVYNPYGSLNVIRIAIFISSMISIIFSILSIATGIDTYEGSGNLVHVTFSLFSYNLYLIKWLQIHQNIKNLKTKKLSKRNSILLVVLSILFIVVITCTIIFYTLYDQVDKRKRNIWIYFFGSWIFLISVIYILIIISILIVIVRVYLKIRKIRNQMSRLSTTKYSSTLFFLLFEMKLTGYMIILNLHILVWGVLRAASAMTLIFGRDFFTIEYDILAVPMYTVGKIMTTVILTFGSIDYSNFTSFWTQCSFLVKGNLRIQEEEKLIQNDEEEKKSDDEQSDHSVAEDDSYVFVI
eukprot:gene5782-9603_t